MSQNWGTPIPPEDPQQEVLQQYEQQYQQYQQQYQQNYYAAIPLGQPLSTAQTWQMAVTQPALETYQQILSDPQATLNRVLKWLAPVAVIAAILSYIQQQITLEFFGAFMQSSMWQTPLSSVFFAIPYWIVMVFVIFFLVTGLTWGFAQALGGNGSFTAHAYGLASYHIPLSLVTSLVSLIPCLGAVVALCILVYEFYLILLVVRAINGFAWFNAIATVAAMVIGYLIIYGVYTFLFIALLT